MSSRLIDRVRGAQQRYKTGPSADSAEFERIKKRLHTELIDALDFDQVSRMPREELAQRLRQTLTDQVEARALPLNRLERERLVEEILDEILGLGPLEPLLRDPEVSDILINGHETVYVERKGRLQKVDMRFNGNDHLMQIIDRIVSAVGRRIDETNPMVDARLRDGSRFNAIIPPLALTALSSRSAASVPSPSRRMTSLPSSCPAPVMEVVRGCVRGKLQRADPAVRGPERRRCSTSCPRSSRLRSG